MDENKVNNLSDQIKILTYEEKKKLYQLNFSAGYLGTVDLNDRLVLISLLTLTYQKLYQQDKTITPLKILIKLTKQEEDDSGFYHFLETLAILVEDFSYGISKVDLCGMKSSQEIIDKIKELLATWLPF